MTESKSIWKSEYAPLIKKLKRQSYTDSALYHLSNIFYDLAYIQKTPEATAQAVEGLAIVTDFCSTGQVYDLKKVSQAIGENFYSVCNVRCEHKSYAQATYAKHIEDLINNVDESYIGQEKAFRFSNLALCLREVYNQNMWDFKDWKQKESTETKLKVSDYQLVAGDDKQEVGRSIIVMPDDPREATAILYKDNKPRTLFAEYDPVQSAETYLMNWYGTDGAYAKHFWEFLDCSKRYPNQKRLFEVRL